MLPALALAAGVLVVDPNNHAPEWDSTTPKEATGSSTTPVRFTVRANDADNDPLTYSLSGLPKGAKAEASEGSVQVSWSPTADDLGVYKVIATVSDGKTKTERIIKIVVEDEHESYFMPGLGYSLWVPGDVKTYGVFQGVTIEFLGVRWVHQNDKRGPSHGRLYLDFDVLFSTNNTVDPAFMPLLGFDLSIEKNPARAISHPSLRVRRRGSVPETDQHARSADGVRGAPHLVVAQRRDRREGGLHAAVHVGAVRRGRRFSRAVHDGRLVLVSPIPEPVNGYFWAGPASIAFVYVIPVIFVGGLALRFLLRALLAGRRARDARRTADAESQTLDEGDTILRGRAELDDGTVRATVEQVGSEAESSGSWTVTWTETNRRVQVAPFYVVHASGERVRVEPGDKTHLAARARRDRARRSQPAPARGRNRRGTRGVDHGRAREGPRSEGRRRLPWIARVGDAAGERRNDACLDASSRRPRLRGRRGERACGPRSSRCSSSR